jgi:hypothetical protein
VALSHEEANAIKNEVLDECRNIFVAIDDCNEKQIKVNEKLADEDKRITIASHDVAAIKKLMWAVASASIGSLVVAFFELVFK